MAFLERSNRWSRWLGLLCVVSVTACEFDALAADPAERVPESPETPTGDAAMVVVGGTGQEDSVTARLGTAYCVRLIDAAGDPVPGVTVRWAVASGDGSVDPVASVTDGSGLARTVHTLGTSLGFQEVTAEADGYQGSPMTFAAYAYHASPTSLAFARDASDTDPNVPIVPAIEVVLVDRFGHVADRTTGTATIALVEGTGTPLAKAAGTLSVSIAAGRATFDNVRVDLPGLDYRLRSTAAGVAAQSGAFDVRILGLP